jgi:flagellar hook-basal body complex protein FliE
MNDPVVNKLTMLTPFPKWEAAPAITGLQGSSPADGVGNFRDLAINLVNQTSASTDKTEALMQDMMNGGKADVHDVIIANTQAELSINLMTATLTKLIQAYDRILQIQL